jgi:broad specificity phosphatase PhoE
MNSGILNNTYYIMRHGESLANVQKLIVSSPEIGISEYGLTDEGKRQTEQSSKKYDGIKNLVIFSSDFKRAYQTALIVKSVLQNENDIILSELLRERFFGDFDMKDNSNYELVWENDLKDQCHNINNVESVASVLKRMLDQISEIESSFKEMNIMLVSHGDSLQILQAKFLSLNPSLHRSVAHLHPAEIRKLN